MLRPPPDLPYRPTMPTALRWATHRVGGSVPFAAGATALMTLYVGRNLPSALYGELRAELGFSTSVADGVLSHRGRGHSPVPGPGGSAVGHRWTPGPDPGRVEWLRRRRPRVPGRTGVGWLFAARTIQGFGVGIATATAQAMLSDRHRRAR
ncbi:hypothetical protein GCM10023215_45620 [Pseudonocardia yuanmonensis]|uniref:MFS transporter n=1 Tax=Pseudonocardia yuanmonensis TaxID=1095914 RepID=A0ABP8X622_9PSEU